MSHRSSSLLLRITPLILYCALIYFVSSMSKPPTPDLGFELSDKVVHASAYGLMLLLAARAARGILPDRALGIILLVSIGFCALYGATDEYHQSFVVGRQSDIFDWVADTTGAILAAIVLRLIDGTKLAGFIYGEPTGTAVGSNG